MTRVDELERALGDATPPDEGPARERARRTILAAHAAAAARPRRRRAARAAGLALTLLGIAGLTQPAVAEWLGETPPARAVSRIVRDVVRPRPTPGPRTVDGPALPAAGRLLVGGPHGLWVVERDGRRHRLGAYSDATWSPNGLFVAVASGRTLAAVTPDDGRVRWRLRLAAPVRDPRWAPDLTHLAYRAGPTLRIVYGNGVHDVPAGAQAAAVAPAWRPTEPHTVAWASRAGTVTAEDADTGRVLWRRRGGPVRWLAWSPDGRRLLVAGRRHAALHDLAAGTARRLRLAPGEELLAAVPGPAGLALAVHDDGSGRTEVRLGGATLLAAPGRLSDLTWSPDGGWLLAVWPAAGRWLLVRVDGRPRVTAVSGFARRFGPGARPRGWCC